MTAASTAAALCGLGVALALGHPLFHAVLIAIGAGCVAFALGAWLASRSPGGART